MTEEEWENTKALAREAYSSTEGESKTAVEGDYCAGNTLPEEEPTTLGDLDDVPAPEVVRIPGPAFDAMVSAIARKLSPVRKKYARVPTFAKAGGDHYQFDCMLTQDRGMLIRMTLSRGAVRQVTLPGELQTARQKSSEAHNRLTKCQGQLETETIRAVPVYARTDVQTHWKNGDYSGVTDAALLEGQARVAFQEKLDCDDRISKANEAVVNAQNDATQAQGLVESLIAETTSFHPEQRVFTIGDIQNGTVLPVYKVKRKDEL